MTKNLGRAPPPPSFGQNPKEQQLFSLPFPYIPTLTHHFFVCVSLFQPTGRGVKYRFITECHLTNWAQQHTSYLSNLVQHRVMRKIATKYPRLVKKIGQNFAFPLQFCQKAYRCQWWRLLLICAMHKRTPPYIYKENISEQHPKNQPACLAVLWLFGKIS